MTNLNLQKRTVKNIVVRLIIITVSTLLILLPIGIASFCKSVERIQNNTTGAVPYKGFGLLPVTIIFLTIEILPLIVWIVRFFTFKKINFPNEEIKTIYCKNISSIKCFSVVGLKIKTKNSTFIYISSKGDESFDTLKKELLHKTLQLKCYQNTNIIKKIDKKSIQ
ncbi:MAG: hypothetical protein IJV80_04105 [Clostridia bacterium]|nr:hypothetical protein [Clostridia bacterium]